MSVDKKHSLAIIPFPPTETMLQTAAYGDNGKNILARAVRDGVINAINQGVKEVADSRESKAHTFAVGDEVVAIIDIRPRLGVYQRKITKIGRKWVTLDNGDRFDIETRSLDGRGYSSPGTVYQSQQEYDEIIATQSEWHNLRSKLPYKLPAGVSMADLELIKSILYQN